MATSLLITNAGADEIAAASQQGTAQVNLTTIKLGSGQYTPTASQTAMQGTVIKTLSATGGGAIDGDVIHLVITDSSSDSYSAYEVGVFSGSGTLVAIASDTSDPILSKATGTTAKLVIDIKVADLDLTSVTFGSLTLTDPPATTTTQGVIEIATDAEVIAGTDYTRAVTPHSLQGMLLNFVYPIGSIYMSVSSTSPATFIGGTWTQLKDAFLLCAGDTYAAASTGGAATHTLSTAELPSHTHTIGSAGGHTPTGTVASGGSHTHTGTTGSESGTHTHSRGSMNITGTFSLGSTGTVATSASGAFSSSTNSAVGDDCNYKNYSPLISFNAASGWTGSTSTQNGSHTHTVTIASGGSHSHTFTGTAVADHTHTAASVGSGTAFSTMPPYLAVYVWKRIA